MNAKSLLKGYVGLTGSIGLLTGGFQGFSSDSFRTTYDMNSTMYSEFSTIGKTTETRILTQMGGSILTLPFSTGSYFGAGVGITGKELYDNLFDLSD